MAGCPQACQLKSYGTTLSYASLSSYNTEELLGDNHTDLYEKYSHALEMQNVSAAFILFDVSMPNSMLIRLIWTRNIHFSCWNMLIKREVNVLFVSFVRKCASITQAQMKFCIRDFQFNSAFPFETQPCTRSSPRGYRFWCKHMIIGCNKIVFYWVWYNISCQNPYPFPLVIHAST